MITFKEFLIEGDRTLEYSDEQLEKFAKTLKKDCGFFLNLIKNDIQKHTLFRGTDKLSPTQISFSKLKVLKNRKPTHTNSEIHEIMNNWMHEKFGIKHRSESLFTTSVYYEAKAYGTTTVLVFPIGKFEYLWSSVYDDVFLRLPLEPPEDPKVIEEILIKGKYSDKNFINAINSEHEIMINCNEYYIFNIGKVIEKAEDLIDRLGKYL